VAISPDTGAPVAQDMDVSSVKRVAVALLALTISAGLAACQPTGSARCDKLQATLAQAESYGYRVRCDATFPGVSSTGQNVLGWTDHTTKTIWMWPAKMTDQRVLRKVAWHEVGHIAWTRQHRTGTQSAEERWADGYAYCAEPIQGVGYSIIPTDCRGYR
jgi:hypothetical protein